MWFRWANSWSVAFSAIGSRMRFGWGGATQRERMSRRRPNAIVIADLRTLVPVRSAECRGASDVRTGTPVGPPGRGGARFAGDVPTSSRFLLIRRMTGRSVRRAGALFPIADAPDRWPFGSLGGSPASGARRRENGVNESAWPGERLPVAVRLVTLNLVGFLAVAALAACGDQGKLPATATAPTATGSATHRTGAVPTVGQLAD